MDIILQRITDLIEKKPDGTFKHGAKNAFAQKLGFKDGHIVSDWIAGRNTSYKNYIHQIASTHNVSVEWLKGETDIKQNPTTLTGDGMDDSTKRLLEIFMNASDIEKAELLGHAEYLASKKTGE